VAIDRTFGEGTGSAAPPMDQIPLWPVSYAAGRRDGREWHAAPPGVKNAGLPLIADVALQQILGSCTRHVLALAVV
jgi:hypothetical protein